MREIKRIIIKNIKFILLCSLFLFGLGYFMLGMIYVKQSDIFLGTFCLSIWYLLMFYEL